MGQRSSYPLPWKTAKKWVNMIRREKQKNNRAKEAGGKRRRKLVRIRLLDNFLQRPRCYQLTS